MNVNEMLRLDGRVAIVTGGRGLYGATISTGLCEMGATVVVASRNAEKCEEFAQTLRDQGYQAVGMALDLGDDESIQKLIEGVIAKFGRLDILVNNAVDRRNMVNVENATRQKLQDSCNINLTGQILLTQAALKPMLEQGKGNIINISSMRGTDSPHFPFYPDAMQRTQVVNYTTEKWALVGFTKFLAGRYGKSGIRVNCLCPGGYDPDLKKNDGEAPFVKIYEEHCPLGCWAGEDDIKGPVAFLASDASHYIHGATVMMDGGWTIW